MAELALRGMVTLAPCAIAGSGKRIQGGDLYMEHGLRKF
jgi:hypothetical protein